MNKKLLKGKIMNIKRIIVLVLISASFRSSLRSEEDCEHE